MLPSSPISLSGALLPLLLTLLLALLPRPVSSQRATPQVVTETATRYAYFGCWNETTDIANSDGSRALENGAHEVLAGNMTVARCLAFCGTGGNSYAYAGLEYARECWCADAISGLSVEFPDGSCDLGCDGNASEVCGGTLKLTVYKADADSVVGLISGTMVLALFLVLLVMNSL